MAFKILSALLAACALVAFAPSADAHGRMIAPIGRQGTTDGPIASLPCNGLPPGNTSVATFVAGKSTQISYVVTEFHGVGATCFIDISAGTDDKNFRNIHTIEHCADFLGSYVTDVSFPTDISGRATLRWFWHVPSINVTFATCSDIDVVKPASSY
ncbi:hypothetical protein BZG36_02353 [Bifiguratus adelaidae]|uniref:Chitin-binding type-4 domain-containing protein n=1 Tax=Bifiguratus adelaidae TaxID=1938954 RepID=A0A261Y2H3_9FUNG|nr:hypothetical protein BZG36_02353 [Bifiguratus adelaidae]